MNELRTEMNKSKKRKYRGKEEMKKKGARGIKEARQKQMKAVEQEEKDQRKTVEFSCPHCLLVIRSCCMLHYWTCHDARKLCTRPEVWNECVPGRHGTFILASNTEYCLTMLVSSSNQTLVHNSSHFSLPVLQFMKRHCNALPTNNEAKSFLRI